MMKFAILSISIAATSIFCLPSHSEFRNGHARALQHRREARALAESQNTDIPNSHLFFLKRSMSPFDSPVIEHQRELVARSDEGEDDEGEDEGDGDEDEECEDNEDGEEPDEDSKPAPTHNVTSSTSAKPVVGKDKESYTKPVDDKKDSYTKPVEDKKDSYTKPPVVTKPVESKPVEVKPVETKPAETKPESKPVESKPVEIKPVESKPVEDKKDSYTKPPVVIKPVDTKPAETKPAETKPENKPVENKPVDTKPAETKPESKPVESKPVETKPAETKPVETTPAYTPPTPKQRQTSPPKTDKDDSYTKDDYAKGGGGGNAEEHVGKATFYEQGGVAGSCGVVHSDQDFIVAIDIQLYGAGKFCGKKIAVTRVSTGKTIICTGADLCPGCPSAGSLDLSEAAFKALGKFDEGVFDIDWEVRD